MSKIAGRVGGYWSKRLRLQQCSYPQEPQTPILSRSLSGKVGSTQGVDGRLDGWMGG